MSQFFMNSNQEALYRSLCSQAEHLNQCKFSNEMMERRAWEDLLVRMFTFAHGVNSQETMFFLLDFNSSDSSWPVDQLKKVFYGLSDMLQIFVNPEQEKERSLTKKPCTEVRGAWGSQMEPTVWYSD